MQDVVDIGVVWGDPAEPDDPRDVTDWPERQRRALVPYEVRAGVPIHPGGLTSPIGRNARRWGENPCGDAALIDAATWSIALIRRDDCGDWALPGGHMDLGETPSMTIARELREETGARPEMAPRIIYQGLVSDPRATAWAWYATSLGVYLIRQRVQLVAADDAADVAWFRLYQLDADLAERGGRLYPAHQDLVSRVRTWLETRRP